MQPIKVFISSRVGSKFERIKGSLTLSELRKDIQKELHQIKLFNKQLFEVIINENNFNDDFSKDAFDQCMREMRECNIIIILYNGEAGWTPEGTTLNGICHEEFAIAMNDFPGMSHGLDLSNYFTIDNKHPYAKANRDFQQFVGAKYRSFEKISSKTAEDIKKEVLEQIQKFILDSLEDSFSTRKEIDSASVEFGITLDWSKMNYTERSENLTLILKEKITGLQMFSEIICQYHAIPDNMSVADARNRIARPFLEENKFIQKENLKSGVIHIVAVYGSATELQVKNMLGYPDVTVIKGSFGFYLWDKSTQIQMFFLHRCINPASVSTRCSQFRNWLNSSDEYEKIKARAKGRYSILKEMEKWQKDTELQ